jgi:hypothetical protein
LALLAIGTTHDTARPIIPILVPASTIPDLSPRREERIEALSSAKTCYSKSLLPCPEYISTVLRIKIKVSVLLLSLQKQGCTLRVDEFKTFAGNT